MSSSGTNEATRHFRPQASSLVRAREQEIMEWLQHKDTWAVITHRLDPSGGLNEGAVIKAYLRREKYRFSDERANKIQWLRSNYAHIEMMLRRGDEWFFILKALKYPVKPGSVALEIAELESEFQAMNERALNHKDSAVYLVEPEANLEVVSFEKTPRQGGESKPQVTTTKVDSGTTEVTVPRPRTGIPTEAERFGLTPRHDPFESGIELHERMMSAARKKNEMYKANLSLPEGEREAAKERHAEASKEYDQLRADFLYRFSDFKAKYSKLQLLAAKALECGAFEVVDVGSDNAMVLQGYDRPDTVNGFDKVPEPLFIRENLTDDELVRIDEAYATDGLELGERAPVVRLAEALCLRGEYLFRLGWHEYDTLVRLEGGDFPSPTLCGANKWNIRARAIELWPKLTGIEPVQPREYERKRLTYRPDPELEKRGEWT